MDTRIIAVCGKGGVGKTSFSAMLARVLIDAGVRPLLLIDADPAGGLTLVTGECTTNSLAAVRDRLIESARSKKAKQVADQLDYLLFESLVERSHYSLLAMGHSTEKGCFCPANQLLRGAIAKLARAFKVVLIDAEAGIEQINRDVTRDVDHIISIVDGSRQSLQTARLIMDMVDGIPVSVVSNRLADRDVVNIPEGINILNSVPEDETLKRFNRKGQPLLELPPDNEALQGVRRVARAIGLLSGKTR